MARNVLLLDPTRTTGLRKRFEKDMARRFRWLRKQITELVVDLDVFGLAKGEHPLGILVERQAWRFRTDSEKLTGFNSWFQGEIDRGVLSVDHKGDPWTGKYVDSAYRKGSVRAYTDARKELLAPSPDFYAGGKEQFLRQAFAQPERISKLRFLSTRTFEELKGISAAMSQQVSRTLALGIANGLGARELARQLNKTVEGIDKRRARVLARTEVIAAHAEGQLDSFEDLGVKETGVMAEWSTSKDNVCELCLALEGVVMKVSEARGLIPRHPNCRCAWLPSTEKKKATKAKKKKAVDASIQAERPKKPLREAKARSSWVGKEKDIGGPQKTIAPPSRGVAKVSPKAPVPKTKAPVAAPRLPKPKPKPPVAPKGPRRFTAAEIESSPFTEQEIRQLEKNGIPFGKIRQLEEKAKDRAFLREIRSDLRGARIQLEQEARKAKIAVEKETDAYRAARENLKREKRIKAAESSAKKRGRRTPLRAVPEPGFESSTLKHLEGEMVDLLENTGMSKRQFKEEMTEFIRGVVNDPSTEMTINVPNGVLKDVLRQGRYKTQFETSASGGVLDPSQRGAVEEALFGYAKNTKALDRPVYGALQGPKIVNGEDLNLYGTERIVLKKKVRNRVTVTGSDSMAMDSVPKYIDDVDWTVLPSSDYELESLFEGYQAGVFRPADYMEFQVHGQVLLEDIEFIRLSSPPSGELAELLKKKGVAWKAD